MFRVLVFSFLVLLCANVGAQNKETSELLSSIDGQWQPDENGYVTYQKIVDVPDASMSELYAKAESYFAYHYKDANSVIQARNPESGLVVGKGIFPDVHTGQNMITIRVSTRHILKIECKDNRARVTLSLTDYIQRRSGGGSSSTFEYPLNDRFPLTDKDSEKNVMGKAFYKSHLVAQQTLAAVEEYLKKETKASNSDW